MVKKTGGPCSDERRHRLYGSLPYVVLRVVMYTPSFFEELLCVTYLVLPQPAVVYAVYNAIKSVITQVGMHLAHVAIQLIDWRDKRYIIVSEKIAFIDRPSTRIRMSSSSALLRRVSDNN